MVGLLLLVVIGAIWLAVMVGLLYFASMCWRAPDDDAFGGMFGKSLAIGSFLVALFTFAFPLAILSGDIDWKSVPDGCYRIGTVTGSSTAVIPTGKSVVIVPIVTSGRTYTPIACPA